MAGFPFKAPDLHATVFPVQGGILKLGSPDIHHAGRAHCRTCVYPYQESACHHIAMNSESLSRPAFLLKNAIHGHFFDNAINPPECFYRKIRPIPI